MAIQILLRLTIAICNPAYFVFFFFFWTPFSLVSKNLLFHQEKKKDYSIARKRRTGLGLNTKAIKAQARTLPIKEYMRFFFLLGVDTEYML